MNRNHRWALVVTLIMIASTALGQHPISGKPVPALSFLEDPILEYMDANNVHAAVVGIAHGGEIIYWRGFGWKDQDLTIPLQETAAFRVASVTKTFTAAMIMDLVNRGFLDLNAFAFNLGQPEGGILDLVPFPNGELGDPRLAQIRVVHLLSHTAGWDRDLVPDPTGQELVIQNAMGLPQLPDQEETMRWVLGRPLQHTPGFEENYANIGYLALGLIAQQVSGTDLLSYVRTYLLTDELWFPARDILMGRTFAAQQDPREPFYNYPVSVTNVFDPDGPLVWKPYGGWNHELKDYYGRIVATAIPLLHQASHFVLNGVDRGQPLPVGHSTQLHGGALYGARAELYQGSNGTDLVVMTNRYDTNVENSAQDIRDLILEGLSSNSFLWPHELMDFTWFDFAHSGAEEGSYDLPYGSVNDLGNIAAYTKVKIKPGSTPWSGVITRGHISLHAESGGSAVIGQ